MAQEWERKFQLPSKLESLLASTSMYFRQNGHTQLERLIVNSRATVDEAISWDNWDGGQAGHRIRLQVPRDVYYGIIPKIPQLEKELQQTMNPMVRFDGEHIEEVVIELQDAAIPPDWRERTGLVIRTGPELSKVADEDLGRIWTRGFFRLFLSHKSNVKIQATAFKKAMGYFGVSCFVAHEDIEPTRDWQLEIEKALFSMEALVALLTDGFHESDWTDQEIGVGIGRGVTIVSVRAGVDPYGFIGKYQGLQAKQKKPTEVAKLIFDLLWAKMELRPRLAECVVTRLESAESWQHTNRLMAYLLQLQSISRSLFARIDKAASENIEVKGASKVTEGLQQLGRRAQ